MKLYKPRVLKWDFTVFVIWFGLAWLYCVCVCVCGPGGGGGSLIQKLTSTSASSLSLTGSLLTLWLIARLRMCLGSCWKTRFLLDLSASVIASIMLWISSALDSANSATLIPRGAREVTEVCAVCFLCDPGVSSGIGFFHGLFFFGVKPCTCDAILTNSRDHSSYF